MRKQSACRCTRRVVGSQANGKDTLPAGPSVVRQDPEVTVAGNQPGGELTVGRGIKATPHEHRFARHPDIK
jgi:hypothetical protein